MGNFEHGLTAFIILLREGTEVLLILYAVYAVTGRSAMLPIVLGTVVGIGLNIALSLVFNLADLQSPSVDKAVMLMAAAMMLYVARGLLLWRMTGEEKKNKLQKQVYSSMSDRVSMFGLTTFVVGREAFELLLFSEALRIRAGGWSGAVFVGFGLAAVCLVPIYWLLDRLTGTVPLRVMFAIASAWLVIQAGILLWEVII
jgi:high-affinity Fe2+/Pb2+ permease